MKNLFRRIRSAVSAPLVAAAFVAVTGATAVHACPDRADFVFDSYTIYCTLMIEYQGMCLMDCVSVEHQPRPMI